MALQTLHEGQISYGGMQDVLEAVSRHKNVKNGVLCITSDRSVSGLIGVFCGQYLTGAVLTLSGDSGFTALQRLLTTDEGAYSYMDAEGEMISDLAQSLAVDISMLPTNGDFSEVKFPLSGETLTGLKPGADSMGLIDTTLDLGEPAPAFDVERIDRINATFDRILSLASFSTAEEAIAQRGKKRPSVQRSEPANNSQPGDITIKPMAPIPHPGAKDQLPAHANSGNGPKPPTFERAKTVTKLSPKKVFQIIKLLLIFAAIIYLGVTYGPRLAAH